MTTLAAACLGSALLAPLSETTAYALGGPSPGAVSAQTVKLPSGPGSVRGLADNATVTSFTGQVQYAVPVELPKGPGGIAPSLSLGYSGDLGNGPLGVGWAMSQAGIRRSTRLGVPSYTDSDELELVGLGAGGELVRLADGTYRVEGQGQSYVGRVVNGGFELLDADGTIYRFGVTAAGRKASGVNVAFWYLEQVVDVAGQTIDYVYRQAGSEVYLDAIAWGPEISGERSFRAELVYEGRADAVVSYRTGFRVESAERLDEIRVWSFGEVQRIVDLSYDDSFALTRLSGVSVTSADGADAMPPLAFHYATPQAGAVASVTGADGWALNLSGTSLFDVDDDGAMDLLRLTATGHSYRRNLGGRFDAVRTVPGAEGAALDKVRLLDLSGDSGAEMVWQQGTQWKVFQLGGANAQSKSWTAQGNLAGAQNVTLSSVAVADLDGDYRMDVLSVSGTRIQVRMGTETGLTEPVRFPAIDAARSFIQPGNAATSFPDINGDGLADVVYTATNAFYLYLGKGAGEFEKYRDVPYPWTGTIDTSQIRLGDLNRDGLLDVAVVRAGNVAWYRGEANGTFEATPVVLARPPGTDASVVVALADANGNGSEDVVWSSTAGLWIVDLAGATSAGMLTAIDNGMGQTQSFQYTASAQLAFAAADAGAPWTTSMPVSIPVTVKNRLTLASGEPARSTRLDVRDGIYDRVERRFIGFGQAIVTRPDPADGATAAQTVRQIQTFHPGLGDDRVLRGQVLTDRIEDGAGHVYRETTHEVAAVTVAGLPTTEPRLRRAIVRSTEVRHHEGLTTPLTTRVAFVHDDEGRVTEEHTLGRLDLTGDESIVRRRYTTGRSARGVRDKVCEEWLVGIVQDGAEAGAEILTTHTQTLFGDHQPSPAALCDAGAGRERVVRQYLDDTNTWIDIKSTSYDAHGNRLSSTEGGVTRRFEMDAHGMYPLAEVVQPSAARTLRWEATWSYRLGQPVTVRDATGDTIGVQYDGLGRPVSLARVGRAAHVHYRYHVAGPRPSVETLTYDGDSDTVPALPSTWTPQSGWRHAVEVFDSAGETFVQATRLDVTRWLLTGMRQRDALGRTVAISDTFAWTGGLAALAGAALPAGTPVRTTTYDGLDRIVESTLPTGARNRYAYNAFSTTVTTDGLAPVTTELDGQDRIRHTTRTLDGAIDSVAARYDAADRIVSMRIAGGTASAEHRFAYDTLGRLVFATDPDIGDRHLSYDGASRLVAHTNGAGQTIEYAYDDASRLTTMSAGDGSRFTYHYDDARDGATFARTASRLAWVEEPTGTVELGYDAFGRVAHQRRTVNGHVADEKTTFSPSGLLLRVDQGDGLVLDYGYDAAGRAIRIGDLWQLDEQDAAGRVLREHFGNGIVQSHQRDVLGQSTRLQVLRGAPIYDAAVAYNTYGAITSVTDTDGAGLDHSAAFSYDGGARLAEALLGTGPAQYRFRYQYDGLQNMIRREAQGPRQLGALTGAYRYGGTGASGPRGPRQLTSVVPDAAAGSPAGAATTTFDYDAAGRMTRQGALALDYNAFDQLVRVSGVPGTSGVVEHAYGYDGLRIVTRAPGGAEQIWFTQGISQRSDGVREHYIRLGDRLIARITRSPALARAEAARDSAAIGSMVRLGLGGAGLLLVLAALALPRRRQRGRAVLGAVLLVGTVLASCAPPTSSAIELAARTTRQTLFYHQTIGAGPSLITRGDGTILEERRYEPFGEEIDAYRELPTGGTATGAIDYAAEPHNLLGKPADETTGWSYHGARWMAPETGRWLTPDPPVKAPDTKFMAEPWGLHPYQFVSQNPVLFWDPDGRDKVKVLLVFGSDQPFDKREVAQFKKAATTYFKGMVGSDVEIKTATVSNAKQLKKALKGRSADVVIYLGHSSSNVAELTPGGQDGAKVSVKDVNDALGGMKSKPDKMYLYGCDSESNGFAQGLSKLNKDMSVVGATGDVEATFETWTDPDGTTTRTVKFTRAKMIEYKHTKGVQMRNGKAAPTGPKKIEINLDQPLPREDEEDE